MTGDTHYDLEILAELAEGLLDAGTASRVREHLAVCDPCGELLADLAAVREVLAATPTPAMPMGVAMRIDKALAREGGLALADPPMPDWDELSRDAPWETAPAALGVVSDDGTIVPARRRTARQRRWAMPAVAAAAAAVVVGTSVATVGLLAGGDSSSKGTGNVAVAKPSQPEHLLGLGYSLTNSDWTYSDSDFKKPLQGYFAPAPIVEGASSVDPRLARCVTTVTNRSHLRPFAVDQGLYNGQEAAIIASWKDQGKNRVRVDVVDPFNCKNLRKPSVGRWN
ncbi:anti-sigma factor family protein [Nonomuraea sp. NPDC050556]|uniref:anti-sigma factor family protein n=1 Tax=Nonomuraea sp. NPDC050556 TaxID=3364369 RepID=UPI0037A3C4AC